MTMIATLTMNPAIDLSCRVEHVSPNQKLRCRAVRRDPGGGGINVSRAVSELGGSSKAIYPAGGSTGDRLRQLLEGTPRLDQRSIPVKEPMRENVIVAEERSEQQYRFGMPGAELAESEWRACLSAVGEVDELGFLVASGSLPPGVPSDFYARVANQANEIGVRLILDTRGEPLRRAVRDGVYLLKPNLRELAEMFEEDGQIEGEDHQEELVQRILDNGWSDVVVLSLGASGVLLASRDGKQRLRSPTVPIRSRVGAGDSMVAGIVHALATGKSIAEAVRLGVAAGAAAVTTPGTQLCRREDVERLEAALADGA